MLSILIVNWNTAELLGACIDSIYKNLPASSVSSEIIVVDNASTDHSVELVQQRYPGVILIRNNENLGFGAAVNQARKASRGEYLFLLNSDAVIIDDGVPTLIQLLDADDSIGIVTGEMLDEDLKAAPSYFAYPGFWILVKAYTIDRLHNTGRPSIRGKVRGCSEGAKGLKVCEVDWVSGGYMIVRRSSLGGAPMFDTRIFMYFEDTLLCRAFWQRGIRVVYAPYGTVRHLQGASVKKLKIKSVWFSYSSSRIYISERYGAAAVQRYESVVRILWKLLYAGCSLVSWLGGSSRLREKKERFEFLLNETSVR